MGPELIVIGGAFLIMLIELLLPQQQRKVTPWLAVIDVLLAALVTIARFGGGILLYSNADYVVDGFSSLFKLLILLGTFFVLLLAIAEQRKQSLPYEYSYLMLFASGGAMIITSGIDLVLLYVGLELLSIATYILVALNRKDARSSEGGLKYLIIGSIASASILYGLSFLYGVAGSTNLGQIAVTLQNAWANDGTILFVSFALILAGVAVKISVVPFHLWTPDVYEGAPTPVTAYLAVISKAAVIAFFLRVFLFVYGAKYQDWWLVIAWLAVLTMIIGNFGALAQRNVKRILAYSSIGQVGYLLMPFAAIGQTQNVNDMWQALSATVFYLFAYAFMTIGAFAIFGKVAQMRGSEQVEAFAGLYRTHPWLAAMMAIFLLSLAGLPLTGGFFGKFMIFLVAFNAGQYWLGVILFATSAVAFYYYFGILKAIFVQEPPADVESSRSGSMLTVLVGLCALGTLVLGLLPDPFLHILNTVHWFG
ncbi:hypothetical protein BM613_06210 [Sulfoacidibacillus thermotolerans]|uniref:NADH-quinone oxidoreductase subunit N n=2 Tax=Sulfoacidibacillus thermotolerans TaxID=1765684 RepID=A0A2U3D9S2_SULT2|nr:hypothetical protein BM613_06210 [Sulfoacidibacillus thermotolerans]